MRSEASRGLDDRRLPVFDAFPPIIAIGSARLQQLCDDSLATPVAKECAVSRITVGKDGAIDFEARLSHNVHDGEDFHFPLDDLLLFIVDHAISADQQEQVKAAIFAARRRGGPTVYQRFRLNLAARGPKRGLFITCKTPGCRNIMQTQHYLYPGESFEGGPFHAACPKCGNEQEFAADAFHFMDGY